MRHRFLNVRHYRSLAKLFMITLLVISSVGMAGCTWGPIAWLRGRKPTETPQPVVEVQATQVLLPTSTPYPTYTPYPTDTPYPTYTPFPTVTPSPTAVVTGTGPLSATVTVTPTMEVTATLAPTPTLTPIATEVIATATPTEIPPTPTPVATSDVAEVPQQPTPTSIVLPPPSSSGGWQAVTLDWVPDADPAPPFTVLVSSLRMGPDSTYKVVGTVRNDSQEVYEAIGVVATFFDKHEFRHVVRAQCPCLVLEPGGVCPFSARVIAKDLVGYALHPEGRPSEYRRLIPVATQGVRVSGGGRIVGTVVNQSPHHATRHIVVAGALLDASGQMVSLGSTFVLEHIPPGGSASFSLYIEYTPYTDYRLYVQAEQE